AALEAQGRKPAIRFRTPEDRNVVVNDLVRGEVTFEGSGIGDFIIVKSDGIPTYNFAVVIDDHTMEISHVIRAEEHLSNTPRQIVIYEALGWQLPEFAHVSLILGQDRSKMSKRHGATAIEQYQAKGYLPEALVNFLALLGWSPGGENEILSLEQLIEQFSLERVSKSPAVFDLNKLNWLNAHYIRTASLERITGLAIPYLEKAGYISTPLTEKQYEWMTMLVSLLRDYLNCLEEITEHAAVFFVDRVDVAGEEAREIMAGEQVPAVLGELITRIAAVPELTEDVAKQLLKEVGKAVGVKGKGIFMPVRVALTGHTHGPDLNKTMVLLGREGVAVRLQQALTGLGH
ncbi:MAG: glutamate--tRNA ligase, partial [Peptococcaceae bacterium]|nr:glutamate--tRNA ligase [Peptococcaceae bacterium]